MYLGEKIAPEAKNPEKTTDIRIDILSGVHPKTSRHRSLKRNAPWKNRNLWDKKLPVPRRPIVRTFNRFA
jgi:hypothetical protein